MIPCYSSTSIQTEPYHCLTTERPGKFCPQAGFPMSCLILQTLALGNHNVEEIRELSLECLWNVFKPSSFPKARSRSSKACTACKCEVHFSVSAVDRAFTGSM